jgi:ABC-type multidrug transport system fused ATPase/permease subunit
MLRMLLSRVLGTFRRSRLNQELDDELREHLAMLQERFNAVQESIRAQDAEAKAKDEEGKAKANFEKARQQLAHSKVALAADTASISVMELMDNLVLLVVPGALAAGLADGLFWASLAASLVVAFVVTVPVNRALIARGKGHAVMHALH